MKFYRYEKGRSQNVLGFGYNIPIHLREFELIKETPKGYWINIGYQQYEFSSKKWVSKTGKKRYAYPTKEEALGSAIMRTKRRLGFLERDKQIAAGFLFALENVKEPEAKVVDMKDHSRKEIYKRILNRKME